MKHIVQVSQLNEQNTSATALNQFIALSNILNIPFVSVEEITPTVAAAVAYSSGEIGDISTVIVVIVFTATINSPLGDYTLGVTIKVNAVSVTISSAALQAGNTTVRFTLASAVDINDEITYEYNSGR